MPIGEKLIKKNAYMAKLVNLVETSPLALIVCVDNVGSKQMQRIRIATRGKCILLMGKNTMIRTALRKRIEVLTEENDGDESCCEGLIRLKEAINGNMGFVFCNTADALNTAREIIAQEVVPAAAKSGAIAPKDVVIPGGPTGLEPAQTNFFQALNIPTKIVKGAIEMIGDFKICAEGEKVSLSAQALLSKLHIKPFEYGMKIREVYQDGAVFDAAVLDMTDDVLAGKFMVGASNVAAFGREIGIPTAAGLPHMLCNAFKNIVATVVDIEFDAGEKVSEIKAILSDPEALAKMKAGAAASSAPAASGGGKAAAAAAPVEEEEEEDVDFDLFG